MRATVSQVTESRMDGFAVGDFVFNTNRWTEYALIGEGAWRPGYMVPRKLDPSVGRISQAVGVLGMLGLTAYSGGAARSPGNSPSNGVRGSLGSLRAMANASL
ncbi:hypothetical protein GA0061098_10716 [Bradyrhizobium shewense]|uniref:Uncharacterized protein n=1 Tax=Bradyrhizobium shewense TaxID=1761772 RepID=A0A1C3XUZ9_9BRAD|nr:hypothetical protein [Bradyrhizobium shewense]SCB56072.1 hypothetical protein GA0061098_10716 [Bradyrhizobium shewense]